MPPKLSSRQTLSARARWLGRGVLRAFHWLRLLWRVLLISLVVLIAGVGIYASRQLHSAGISVRTIPALADPSRAPLPQPLSVYSSDGILLGRISAQRRRVVSLQQIAPAMREAIVAIEDERFYQHPGVDLQAILRAAYVDARAGKAEQGASTITQQYVRNVYLNFQKTANRKVNELALALQLEAVYSKKHILWAYLTTVYFGEGAYGVQAAAETYFSRPASQLLPHQAATLAALVNRPEGLRAREKNNLLLPRRNLVLDAMFAQGHLSKRELVEYKNLPLGLAKPLRESRPLEPALLSLVLKELRARLDPVSVNRGGLVVKTSLHLGRIRKARSQLRAVYPDPVNSPVVAASFLEARTGRVVLLAHNKKGVFEFSAQARRQPGSTVKAFTLATRLRQGARLSDPVDNSPLLVRDGRKSYTLQPSQSGVKTLQDGLRFSQNPVFWRQFQLAGPKRVLAFERRLGLQGMDSNPAAALGGVKVGVSPLQLSGAFASFANQGRFIRPHMITEVNTLDGEKVYRDQEDRELSKRTLSPEYARQMNVALQRTVKEGQTRLRASLPLASRRPLAGKTGTTEDNGDAWFAGYTPQLSGAVWTGYARSRASLRDAGGADVFGATIPAKAFNTLASELLAGQPVERFPRPKQI